MHILHESQQVGLVLQQVYSSIARQGHKARIVDDLSSNLDGRCRHVIVRTFFQEITTVDHTCFGKIAIGTT